MFFPDVAKAAVEFARVLKPGGRVCSSVWAGPGENPWTTIAMQAIAAEAVVAPPGPDGPGIYRCAAPGYVSALYQAAGLRDVAGWDIGVELVTRSPAQYWEMISEHVSLAVAALAQVGEPARERIRAQAIGKVSAFEKDGQVRVPGLARCIVGTKQNAGGARPRDGARTPKARAGRPSRRPQSRHNGPSRAIEVRREPRVTAPIVGREGSRRLDLMLTQSHAVLALPFGWTCAAGVLRARANQAAVILVPVRAPACRPPGWSVPATGRRSGVTGVCGSRSTDAGC